MKLRIPKHLRTALLVTTGLLSIVLLALLWAYYASKQVPEFYAQAVALDTTSQQEASQEMSSRVTMLYSDAQRDDTWHALFTTEQINGWLAVDLVKKHKDLLPGTIRKPRVKITPEAMTLALRYEDENISTVFSLGVEPYLVKANVIGLRFRKVRAGGLPLPVGDVLEHVTEVAHKLEFPLHWTQVEGDPVALVTIATARDKQGRAVELDTLELHDGELYLAGRKQGAESAPKSQLEDAALIDDSDTGEPAQPSNDQD